MEILLYLVMTAVWVAVLVAVGSHMKETAESRYPLFFFLYSFVAGSSLAFSGIPLPLGFFLCAVYLAERPRIPNRRAKMAATGLGLLGLVLSCLHFLPSLPL